MKSRLKKILYAIIVMIVIQGAVAAALWIHARDEAERLRKIEEAEKLKSKPPVKSEATIALVNKVHQILESEDLRNISYIENLFSVHFSQPTYTHVTPSAANDAPDSTTLYQSTADKKDLATPQPYTLQYKAYVRGSKESFSSPYVTATATTLDINNINSRKLCLTVNDFEPLFDTPPVIGYGSDNLAPYFTFKKLTTLETITLIVDQRSGSCASLVTINFDYGPSAK